MEKEEILKKLKELKIQREDPNCDVEDIHIKSDDLLLQFINDDDITEAWKDIDKYFS